MDLQSVITDPNIIGQGDIEVESSDTIENIQVGIRIKPFLTSTSAKETTSTSLSNANASQCSWTYTEDSIIENRAQYSNEKHWVFDSISSPKSSNKNVYQSLINLSRIQKVVSGYNISILAYGQTGSGKTHTISGNDQEDGILKLTVKDLFQCIEEEVERDFIIRISVLEVYNEVIYDLLSLSKQNQKSDSKLKMKNERETVNHCSNICRLKGADVIYVFIYL